MFVKYKGYLIKIKTAQKVMLFFQILNSKQDLLGQVSRLRKREEQIPPLEWVGPEVR